MPVGYMALLSGINVGGNNKIRMAVLAAVFIEAGCKDVVTYLMARRVAQLRQSVRCVVFMKKIVDPRYSR